MVYRVADLVDTPRLRVELQAGAAGLDRQVAWAQTSDLEEPWSYLAGGELLMKNGQTLPESARGQTALIRGLAEKGMCGLVIGLDAATPELTSAAITLADQLRFPVMVVPYSIGFGAIGRAVADADVDSGRVVATERVYNVIRQSVIHSTRSNVLSQLGRGLSCRLAVLDAATGEVALDGSKPVPDELPTVLVTYDFRGPAVDLVHLQHLASAVAVLLAQQNVRLEHERRIGAEVMAQLCDGRLAAREADRELAERALRPQECSIVAAGGVLPAGERQLHLNLGRRAVPHLLLRRGDLLYALMPVTDQSLAALRQRLGGEATVGISDPLARPGRAPTAVREATWAARVARTAPDRIARFADATMFSVLRDTDEAQVVVDRVLGPLIAYDARHSAEMIKTLDTYLQCDRSWVQTAAALNVHRQTVVYRIQRIEQITGRAISETAALAEFWLALRARDLLALPRP